MGANVPSGSKAHGFPCFGSPLRAILTWSQGMFSALEMYRRLSRADARDMRASGMNIFLKTVSRSSSEIRGRWSGAWRGQRELVGVLKCDSTNSILDTLARPEGSGVNEPACESLEWRASHVWGLSLGAHIMYLHAAARQRPFVVRRRLSAVSTKVMHHVLVVINH